MKQAVLSLIVILVVSVLAYAGPGVNIKVHKDMPLKVRDLKVLRKKRALFPCDLSYV